MNYDYGKRGYLLPKGCKDLIDVSKAESFTVTARLPKLRREHIEITVEGSSARVIASRPEQGKIQTSRRFHENNGTTFR